MKKKDNWAIVVSSCDAFSDLWKHHFQFFKDHWRGIFPKIYLVTDKPTSIFIEGIEIKWFDGNMPLRIKNTLLAIEEKYVLLTLDDYFLIQDTSYDSINAIFDYMLQKRIDYISLFDRRYSKGYGYRKKNIKKPINLQDKYAVNLYPALWDTSFFISCVGDEVSPWEFEPLLTEKARNYSAKCEIDMSGSFVILDVVRKGKILRKANRYFEKHNISINRQITSRRYEIKLWLMDFVKFYFPRPIARMIKRIATVFGAKFYSKE